MSKGKSGLTKEEATQIKSEEASKKIQEILESNKLALQPFLSFSEFGIVPRVRLVPTEEPQGQGSQVTGDNQNTDGQEGDTTEAGAGKEESEPTDSK